VKIGLVYKRGLRQGYRMDEGSLIWQILIDPSGWTSVIGLNRQRVLHSSRIDPVEQFHGAVVSSVTKFSSSDFWERLMR
jgi:hypothetical protein